MSLLLYQQVIKGLAFSTWQQGTMEPKNYSSKPCTNYQRNPKWNWKRSCETKGGQREASRSQNKQPTAAGDEQNGRSRRDFVDTRCIFEVRREWHKLPINAIQELGNKLLYKYLRRWMSLDVFLMYEIEWLTFLCGSRRFNCVVPWRQWSAWCAVTDRLVQIQTWVGCEEGLLVE